MSNEKKRPAYIWWATIFSSAALLGFAIGGLVPWWTVLVPWIIYGAMLLTLLVLAFLAGFISAMIEYQEEKEREKRYERLSRASKSTD